MIYAFYVSGNAGRLKKLIDSNSGVLEKTRVVISDSNQTFGLKNKLKPLNIDYKYFEYLNVEGMNNKLSNFILDQFNFYKIDYCFCFGNHILKGKLVDVYKNRIINFHPSILPMFAGRKSVDQALNNNSTILLGNTAHFIDKGIDTGPIIMQSVVQKSFFNNEKYEGILNIQIDMLEQIHHLLEQKKITFKDNKVVVSIDNHAKPLFFYSS